MENEGIVNGIYVLYVGGYISLAPGIISMYEYMKEFVSMLFLKKVFLNTFEKDSRY